MALLWCDGFDHYGDGDAGNANMREGVYAQLGDTGSTTIGPNTANPRTGTHALRLAASSSAWFTRIFGGNKTTVGLGYAVFLNILPSSSTTQILAQFQDGAGADQNTLLITTTGAVQFRRGSESGTILATSADGVIVAGSYQHFECKVTCDNTAGSVEVRINGVTVLNQTGLDTQNATTNAMAQVFIGNSNIVNSTKYIDDLFAWDTSGSINNNFLGDQKVHTLYPNADTVETDWVRNTGTDDFDAIDDTAPDDDTTYIEATTVGDRSEFGLGNLPANIQSIAGVYVTGSMRKTDAAACSIQQSLVSGASVAAGTAKAVGETYTYFADVFETDPATSAAWTKTGFDAALLRLDRTA